MLKAHSLLYAVYVCLIVSIICGALLYFATLYNQLNSFYNTSENLYIQNQSAVNYAIGNSFKDSTVFDDEISGIQSEIKIKQYGLLKLLVVKTYSKSDTVSSSHFTGSYNKENTCIFLSNASKPLKYSGKVTLIGTKKLPSQFIEEIYLNNSINSLNSTGIISDSDTGLPEVASSYKQIFENKTYKLTLLKDIERNNDSIYFNSFLNETIEIELSNSVLSNIIIKGNFIIHSKDSIQIRENAVLEDVILKSPRITFKEGFKGSVQAFANQKITLDKSVQLNYPSVLCLYNTDETVKSEIKIDEDSTIYGTVVLFGSPITKIDNNSITVNRKSLLVGDLYCSGKTMIEGKVYGSVYTNRFFHKTQSSTYENCIIDGEIDVTKKPSYFISIPIFEDKNSTHGVYKKIL